MLRDFSFINEDVDLKKNLHSAVKYGDLKSVQASIAAGADVNEFRDIETPLIAAIKRAKREPKLGYEISKLLLENGADINVLMKYTGETLLNRAIEDFNWRLVEFLLANGANADLADSHGQTALHILTKDSDKRCIEVKPHSIVDKGYCHSLNKFASKMSVAAINLKDQTGMTALHYLIKHTRLYAIKTLLDLGADPTIRNAEGLNAFELLEKNIFAKKNEKIEAKILLEAADPTIRNANGLSAFELSQKNIFATENEKVEAKILLEQDVFILNIKTRATKIMRELVDFPNSEELLREVFYYKPGVAQNDFVKAFYFSHTNKCKSLQYMYSDFNSIRFEIWLLTDVLEEELKGVAYNEGAVIEALVQVLKEKQSPKLVKDELENPVTHVSNNYKRKC